MISMLRQAALKKAIDLLNGSESAPFPEAAALCLEARRVIRPYAEGKVYQASQAILNGRVRAAITYLRLGLAQ